MGIILSPTMVRKITSFPQEVLLEICSHLSKQDLISLSETCNTMYRIATDPTLALWENSLIPSYMVNEDPEHFLKLHRFKRIKKIFLELRSHMLSRKHISELFETLSQKEYIEEVYFSGKCNLRYVLSDALTNFLKKISSVIFEVGVRVTEDQVRSFLESIENGNNVKRLYLEEMNFTGIDAKLFARAVNRLKKFTSYYIECTDEQVKEMFVEMTENTTLEKMEFHHRHVEFIDADVLAKAFNNLNDLTTDLDLPFTNDQICEMFKLMAQNTKLKKLEISYPDLSFFPANILADAVRNLSEIYMTDIIFSNSQISLMFEVIARNDEKIALDLGSCNLSDIPLELLEEVVEKLKPNSFSRKLRDRIIQLQDENI